MRKIRLNKDTKKETRGTVSPALGAIVFVLITLVVYFSIQISSLGATLVDLETRQNELVKANRSMTDKLTGTRSLTAADQRAEEKGFTRPESVVYLNKTEPVAQLP